MGKGGDPFKVEIQGPKGNNLPVDIKDNGDGTYTVNYQPQDAGMSYIGVCVWCVVVCVAILVDVW